MSNHFILTEFPGLSEQEAAERLRAEGYNELPSSLRKSALAIAEEVVREPMFLLLVACGAIYLLLGDVREAIMLLGFVFVVMGITVSQERKTERALEALRDLSSPRALVIRDGKQKRIAGREVARGDILVLAEGDRVPADATVIACTNLSVDESLLTGESAPVRKSAAVAEGGPARPGGDDNPCVFSGTLVVQGQGTARVHAVGINTEMGKIGRALESVQHEETVLQKETGRVVRKLALFGLLLCAMVVLIYGLTRGDWLNGFLAGLTLAMAVLPEEFPVVLTVFLALGAWRISRNRVLTRRVPAVETLGAATVLCVDKTGTLTQNRMTVSRICIEGESWCIDMEKREPLPERFHEALEYSILARPADELLFAHLAQRRDLVAVRRRLLITHASGGGVHALGQPLDDLVFLPRQKQGGARDVLLVGTLADEAHARRGAAPDLVQQAWPRAVAEHGVLAGADAERILQELDALAHRPRVGEWPEVAGPLVEAAAVESQARETMPAQHQVGVGLVVAKQYVIARRQHLDQIVFEQQRLGLGAGDGRLNGRHLIEHQLDARRSAAARPLKIGSDPFLQVERLADVQHLARAIHHAVDAGTVRQAGDGCCGVEHFRDATLRMRIIAARC